MNKSLACLIFLNLSIMVVQLTPAAEQPAAPQTYIGVVPPVKSPPLVIIYTLSTCPHCKAATEYLTRNNIPFVNREVDTESRNMDELMQIYETMNVPYQKRGVPLILIGDKFKLQGFKEEKIQEALKQLKQQ